MWKNSQVKISRPASEVVGAAEAAPTLATDGEHCEGYRSASVSFTDISVTRYDIQVWVFDGVAWAQASDAAGAPIDIDHITLTWAQTFDVAGFSRIAVIVDNGTAFGSVTRQYSMARY